MRRQIFSPYAIKDKLIQAEKDANSTQWDAQSDGVKTGDNGLFISKITGMILICSGVVTFLSRKKE